MAAMTVLLIGSGAQAAEARITTSFDAGWRFLKADAPGAEKPEFDDGAWRRLDVPHDWSIEGPFDRDNPAGGAGAFLPGGVGWYRKHFTLPADHARRRIFVEFDGVMANSDVWINGAHLGRRPNGYVGFRYELTPHLRFVANRPNVLAVRADNAQQPASRWYTGAGIYRHVRLIAADPVHIAHWGTFVTTPQAAADKAVVRVRSAVVNQSATPRNVALQVTVLDPNGKAVRTEASKPQTVPAGQFVDFQQEIAINRPRRWDIDHPELYRLVARVRGDGATLDEETIPFGIREFHFDPGTGFWLNGRNRKIKGVCLHHDAGALGAAVPLRAWERRLEALKKLGVNAVRTAHNPPAPEFLDLCDRMGFLVMDELFDAWTVAKTPYDYHLYFAEWSQIDLRDTVLRDRNHPSIILYSAGNEIRDTPRAELARSILTSLVEAFHRFDPTRPVTQALFRPNVSHDYENGLADILDVVGQNYREGELLAAHEQKPTRRIVGTETTHERTPWLMMRDNPPFSGQFLWAGIDYLGESRRWPEISDNFGLLYRTSTPRPMAFQRQSWWSERPMVFMTRRVAPTLRAPTDPGYGTAATERRPQVLLPDWTPSSREPHEENVEVYSNCEQVELFLNERSLGRKARPEDDSPRNWIVPFAPGTIRAVASNAGRIVATHALRSAGKPARIVLTADRSKLAPVWDDVAYVSARVVDVNGTLVPTANDLITFHIAGPGVLAAVDNADNASHEPFQASERHAFQGECFAILKARAPAGRITLTASAPGLASASIRIEVVRR